MTNAGWSRNQNTVRHVSRNMGPISSTAIILLLVLIIALFYVAQGTQATNYDYELSRMEDEIAELEAKKEDLTVEKARLTSIAASENSTVAQSMEQAQNSGFVEQ